MFRSFIPFILATLGFTLVSWATKMPLFEWQISDLVTDLSSACTGTLPSHWTTRFGEDLEAKNRPSLLKNLNIVVRRSRIDESLDHASLGLYNSRSLLFVGIVLSITYMWWFLFQDKHDRVHFVVTAISLTVVAVIVCALLSQVFRLTGPAVGQIPYYSEIRDCQGTLTFSAVLSRIHYESLLALLGGVLAELWALSLMLRQVIISHKRRKDSRLND